MRGSRFGTDGAAVLAPPGGANLYRYCGNDPINRADPSGLAPPANPSVTWDAPYGLGWDEFPNYDPTDPFYDIYAGNNTGGFSKWLKANPAKAEAFVNTYVKAWGPLVAAFSKEYEVPEPIIWASILSEMAEFGKADYMELGSSLGPGQLTKATKNYYATRSYSDYKRFVSVLESALYGPLKAPRYPDSGGTLTDLVYHLRDKVVVLKAQIKELQIAEKGGGGLLLPNGTSIKVPAMSSEMKQFLRTPIVPPGVKPLPKPSGANVMGIEYDLGALAVVLVQMNRINPGATGDTSTPFVYEGNPDFSLHAPQSVVARKLFQHGLIR